MPRVKLTETIVKGAVREAGKTQTIFWDTALSGFGLLVGANAKTFIYQRDLSDGTRRVTRRVTLGRWPDELTLFQARNAAGDKAAEMRKGIDPTAQRREFVKAQQRKAWEAYTLRQAQEHHVLGMKAKRCSRRSMGDLVENIARHLGDWLDRPLADITPSECSERHRKLTANNGPYAANGTLRRFRACYNAGRRLHRELPESPTNAIVYNAQHRRREPVVDLAGWYAKVQSLENAIRRDYQMLVALTGLRATDAATIKFSEIDWDAGTLTRPNPKGGPKYAFTIPLSGYVLALLAKRQLENQRLYAGSEWVFPTTNRAGKVTHLQETKEQKFYRDENRKLRKKAFLPGMHRLRDGFITTCATDAKVDPVTIKSLVNHRLPGGNDVTQGYIRPSVEHMRDCVERVTTILLTKMGVIGVAAKAVGA
ncbi:MAG TPA: integrase family protein [Tepidisphaeraceae bacterium]|jgi:integrase